MARQDTHTSLIKNITQLPLPVLITSGILFVLLVACLWAFLLPKGVSFSYGQLSCVGQLTIAPQTMRQTGTSSYGVVFKEAVTVGDTALFSLKTCFEPIAAPSQGESTIGVAPFGVAAFAKRYVVKVSDPPRARTADFIDATVPTTRPLAITLSTEDTVYRYVLGVADKEASCQHDDSTLHCDITALNLTQGAEYDVRLDRWFDTEVETVAKGVFTTLKPLRLEAASVQPGQVFYDKTQEVTFSYDKDLAVAEGYISHLTDSGEVILPSVVAMEGKTARISTKEPLPRNARLFAVLKKAEAADGTALGEAQVTPFETGGGPKVTAVSIGNYTAPLSGTFVVTFDQPIANPTEALGLMSLTGVPGTISITGAKITVTYQAGLCQPFTLTIKKGLENEHGIVQDQDWSFNTRTRCHTTSVIGTSKQGRSIVAYTFGSGARTLLYTGGIHGNERNTKTLLDAWIGELEQRATEIPAGTQIVVVPLLNPDGYVANTRTNASNVDLNRNFSTSDWKTDIQTVTGQPFPGGGGPTPMSEPESQAIAALTTQLRPTLTLSYHSTAAYVIANTCGNSGARAASYATSTGYRNMTGVSGAFSYDISGTYDDWICEKLGLPSILIELSTPSSSEFSRNRAAMWQIVKS